MDKENYACLKAILVIASCDEYLKKAVVLRHQRKQKIIESNRGKKGWFWNRIPETDDDVFHRLNSGIDGYFKIGYLDYPSEIENEINKLRYLAGVSISDGNGIVYVNSSHVNSIYRLINERKQQLIE